MRGDQDGGLLMIDWLRRRHPSERLTSILYGAAAGVGLTLWIPIDSLYVGPAILLAGLTTELLRGWGDDPTDDDVDT